MPFYIAPYIGTGTINDPFRPRASDGQKWHAIDLRPAGQTDGRALLYLPVHDSDVQLVQISDDALATLTQGAKNRMASALGGVALSTKTRCDEIVFDLLFPLTRPQGICPPIKLGRQKKWVVTCGPLRVEKPAIGGGVTITENFNTADSDTLGPTQTWVEDLGDIDIVSNRARCLDAAVARATANLDSDDHYVQALVSANEVALAAQAAGVIARKAASSTLTFYMADVHFANPSSVIRLFRCETGSFNAIGSSSAAGSGTLATDTQYLLRLEVDGSLLSTFFEGGAEHVDETSTHITGNLQTGIRGDGDAGNFVEWDSWEAGDLELPPGATGYGLSGTSIGYGMW